MKKKQVRHSDLKTGYISLKEVQDKYINKLKEEGLVKMASEIPIPEKEYQEETYIGVHVKAHQYFIDYKERIEWIAKIEDYCNSNGLIPTDLIELHREVSKKKNTGLKSSKIDKFNFKEEYRKRKTGQ